MSPIESKYERFDTRHIFLHADLQSFILGWHHRDSRARLKFLCRREWQFNEFLFAGEQFDSDLNLYYNRAR